MLSFWDIGLLSSGCLGSSMMHSNECALHSIKIIILVLGRRLLHCKLICYNKHVCYLFKNLHFINTQPLQKIENVYPYGQDIKSNFFQILHMTGAAFPISLPIVSHTIRVLIQKQRGIGCVQNLSAMCSKRH